MQNSLDLVVDKLFDYAGIFPPAALSLEQALEKSASFESSLSRPGMLANHIVIGLKHLAEINSGNLEKAGFKNGTEFTLCLLGSELSVVSISACLEELATIARFNTEHENDTIPSKITAFELRLTPELGSDAEKLAQVLSQVSEQASKLNLPVFLEPNLAVDSWEQTLVLVCQSIDNMNQTSGNNLLGFKIRGNGPTAIDNVRVARVLEEVSKYSFAFKATAGLHHPIIEKEPYDNDYGFLNLASAFHFLRIKGSKEFPADCVLELLNNSSAKDFSFDDELAWKDFSIDFQELRESKRQYAFSIGSCSLDEPDQDLRRLFSTSAAG